MPCAGPRAELAGASEEANGMTTRSPRLRLEMSARTSSTTPMPSWPIDCPVSDGSMSAYGHTSLLQMQALVTRTIAFAAFGESRTGNVLGTDVAGGVHDGDAHQAAPPSVSGNGFMQ